MNDVPTPPQHSQAPPPGGAGMPDQPQGPPAAGEGVPQFPPAPPAGQAPSYQDAPAPSAPQPRRMQITGIHHITLICHDMNRTIAFYRDLLGMTLVKETTNFDDPDAKHFYFSDPAGTPGSVVTFFEYPQMEPGHVGAGSTHHFALRVGSREEQEAWRDHLRAFGVNCTDVMDRKYFTSIYFHDPDGHIVEIATDGPGFFVD